MTSHGQYSQPNEYVQAKIAALQHEGAQLTAPHFSIAEAHQGDVVLGNRRLLITPNDEGYSRYRDILTSAGLPYIENDPSLGDEQVVVGQIPRSARTIAQVIPSWQPQGGGMTTQDAFYLIGRTIHQIETSTNQIPDPEDLSIRRILLLREQAKILLVPTINFVQVTAESNGEAAESIQNQLTRDYASFGTVALMGSLQRGLGGA